jgi:hypothetical protein
MRTPSPQLPATLPLLPDLPTGGMVVASWYGPAFYGHRTACGQTYTRRSSASRTERFPAERVSSSNTADGS